MELAAHSAGHHGQVKLQRDRRGDRRLGTARTRKPGGSKTAALQLREEARPEAGSASWWSLGTWSLGRRRSQPDGCQGQES